MLLCIVYCETCDYDKFNFAFVFNLNYTRLYWDNINKMLAVILEPI